MGAELGQAREWSHDSSVDWHLLHDELHARLQILVGDLNRHYRGEPALHQLDCDAAGFEWVDCCDADESVVSLLRKAKDPADCLLVVCNFTPVPRHGYQVGVPHGGRWDEVLNSDAPLYGGSGQGNLGGVEAAPAPAHGRDYLLTITLPPLGMVAFKRRPREATETAAADVPEDQHEGVGNGATDKPEVRAKD